METWQRVHKPQPLVWRLRSLMRTKNKTILLFALLGVNIILLCGFINTAIPRSTPPYTEIISRIHLYVHDTGKDYAYPDPHVKILDVTVYSQKSSPMLYVVFEDIDSLTNAQWNDCFFNIEFGSDKKYWIEGRFTGAYRKTLWFDHPTKGKCEIATYFDKVWWTCNYDPVTGEIQFGEYWY